MHRAYVSHPPLSHRCDLCLFLFLFLFLFLLLLLFFPYSFSCCRRHASRQRFYCTINVNSSPLSLFVLDLFP